MTSRVRTVSARRTIADLSGLGIVPLDIIEEDYDVGCFAESNQVERVRKAMHK